MRCCTTLGPCTGHSCLALLSHLVTPGSITYPMCTTHRTDTKLYRLQNPQTPIAKTTKYEQYKMDEYPAGTNAVVAVLAYTGV